MRLNLFLKVVILGALTFAFAIALLSIYGVVVERKRYRDQVVSEVAQSTARNQTVVGPLLVVRYREQVETGAKDHTTRTQAGEIVVLPETLAIRSRVEVEERARGIYRAPVFRSRQTLNGTFELPPRLGLTEIRGPVQVDRVTLVLGVTDPRGLRKPPAIRWGGAPLAVVAGARESWIDRGISADVNAPLVDRAERRAFEIDLDLVGTDWISFVPVGASTDATMESNWPHPSFTGGFLPDERTVGEKGFRASWTLSRFATGVQDWVDRLRLGNGGSPGGCDFSVRFVRPVDVYQQSERAVKYGMLFVLLTFVSFLMFEVLKQLDVHPIQYGLAGAAVALFFLLLLSLSEHVAFPLAYLAASLACVGLLAYYVGHVLHSATRGLGFGALLGVLYGLLYVLLQSEDYALLLGSLLLFGLLAVVMVMTRRVDWYRLGEPAKR